MKKKQIHKTIYWAMLLLFFYISMGWSEKQKEEEKINWAGFQSIPIQHEGRVKPLDSFARLLLLQFSGKTTVKTHSQRLSAIQWLIHVLFEPETAKNYPIFLIESPEILQDLGIGYTKLRDRYSYNVLAPGIKRLYEQADKIKMRKESQLTRMEHQVRKLANNLHTFQILLHSFQFFPLLSKLPKEWKEKAHFHLSIKEYFAFLARKEKELQNTQTNSQKNLSKELLEIQKQRQNISSFIHKSYSPLLAIFPSPQKLQRWKSPWEIALEESPLPSHGKMLETFEEIYLSYQKKKWHQLNLCLAKFLKQIKPYLVQRNQYKKILLEVSYNRYDLFFHALLLYIFSMILCAISWMGWWNRKFYFLSLLLLIIGYLAHSWGIILRMRIQERPPVTTLYESIVFVGWMSVTLAFILEGIFYKNLKTIGLLLGSTVGAGMLFIASKYAQEEDTMKVLVAVLDSNFWLTTHVTTITIGYAACLIAGICGHIFVFTHLISPEKKEQYSHQLYQMTYGTLCFATLFAFLGTILGGLWADQSWGRFWGWDPKENGALLIVLWNSILLHAKRFLGRWGLALGVIFGNIVVAAAWWGVNLLNIGLHTYGFTSGLLWKLLIFFALEVGVILLGIALWYHEKIQARCNTQ